MQKNKKNKIPEALTTPKESYTVIEEPIQRMEKYGKRPTIRPTGNRPCRFLGHRTGHEYVEMSRNRNKLQQMWKKGHYAKLYGPIVDILKKSQLKSWHFKKSPLLWWQLKVALLPKSILIMSYNLLVISVILKLYFRFRVFIYNIYSHHHGKRFLLFGFENSYPGIFQLTVIAIFSSFLIIFYVSFQINLVSENYIALIVWAPKMCIQRATF